MYKNLIAELNNYFKNEVEFFSIIEKEPLIKNIKIDSFQDLDKSRVLYHRKILLQNNRSNDLHAVLVNRPLWSDENFILENRLYDFSQILTLRENNYKPQIISSSTVLFCRETQELILHRRSKDVATYPDRLHILGGAYIPTDSGNSRKDELFKTVVREIHEESNLHVTQNTTPYIVVTKELSTGFIQFCFLGLEVSKESLKNIKSSWEGKVQRVAFKELPTLLKSRDFVPSGKANILTWLKTQAEDLNLRFDNLSATQLYNEILHN